MLRNSADLCDIISTNHCFHRIGSRLLGHNTGASDLDLLVYVENYDNISENKSVKLSNGITCHWEYRAVTEIIPDLNILPQWKLYGYQQFYALSLDDFYFSTQHGEYLARTLITNKDMISILGAKIVHTLLKDHVVSNIDKHLCNDSLLHRKMLYHELSALNRLNLLVTKDTVLTTIKNSKNLLQKDELIHYKELIYGFPIENNKTLQNEIDEINDFIYKSYKKNKGI